MRDLDEGLTPEGFIKTGVRRDRVPAVFEPVIDAVLQEVESIKNDLRPDSVSVYLYGSVATGTARPPLSDVDLLTVGFPSDAIEQIAGILSTRFMAVCRGVGISAASSEDFEGDADAAYGGRVFLRHYCVHLHGNDLVQASESFPGDAKAARGFNGDIKNYYKQWRTQMDEMAPEKLGFRLARKSLLAVAGLISVQDHIWTTDRKSSALQWAYMNAQRRPMVDKLISWSEGNETASHDEITEALSPDGVISAIVNDFQAKIGLWS